MSDTVLTGERHVLELIATGGQLTAVLDAICSLIEEPPLVSACFSQNPPSLYSVVVKLSKPFWWIMWVVQLSPANRTERRGIS